MTVHFDCTLSQTNSPQLTQTKRRRLAQWSLCTFLTVQTHTNKQPTPQTWRALWLYTLTKRCCTLLTVQTVHFWLYRLFTVDCTDCTLLTLQNHPNKQTNSWNLIHRKRRRLANFFTLTIHFYNVMLASGQQLQQTDKQTNSWDLRHRKRRRLANDGSLWLCVPTTTHPIKQTNSRDLRLRKWRRLAKWPFTFTNKQKTAHNSYRETLLTVRTVHLWLYRLYTFDCTEDD